MKRIASGFCTALVSAAACGAGAFTLVGPGARARVVVGESLPDFVWRAAQDLTNDVKKITGADVPLVRGGAVKPGDVNVAVTADGRWEAYSVRAHGGILEITGSDARGAMFGGKEPCRARPEPFANVFTSAATADPFRASLADTMPVFASPRDTYARLAAQRAGFEQTLRLARRALAGTASEERQFAEDFVVYPARLMLALTSARMAALDAVDYLSAGDRARSQAHLAAAAGFLREAISAGEAYCHGKWSNWYAGCEKVSPARMLALTEKALKGFKKFDQKK